MSMERTEKATPKRRQDARKKGQMARGPELPAAAAFLGGLMVVNFVGRDVAGEIGKYIGSSSSSILHNNELNGADVQMLLFGAAKVFALMFLPIVAVAMTASLAGNFAQGGFTLTAAALTPKADRFSPAKNIKKIFGPDSVVNLGKTLVKFLLLSWVVYSVLSPVLADAPALMNAPLTSVAVRLGETLYGLAFRCGLVMVLMAGADYGYSWYKNEKSMKMTKQEIRDEYKEQEGDPMVKGNRRRIARNLVQKRSLAAVPTASVIITNPTHFAIAIRYDREKDAAPVVVAKGADNMAAKIRSLAKENNIPMIENKPLARALYKSVEPNQMIPVEFFSAVAEVLAYVFRQKGH
jgi:flagellar biosynthetic protein FlhB